MSFYGKGKPKMKMQNHKSAVRAVLVVAFAAAFASFAETPDYYVEWV